MIPNPFRYGEAVSNDFFTDRYRERELLVSELMVGHNVLLTGPRYSGKSSLARRVMAEFERRGNITVYVDFDYAYSLPRFMEVFLAELLRSAFRQTKELHSFVDILKEDIKKLLVLKIDKNGELSIDLTRAHDHTAVAQALLELSQLTSEYKKRPCIVCLDEITAGGNLPDELRQSIKIIARAHTRVGYLLISLEPYPEKDLAGFVHLPLAKIEERYLKAFIKTRFENTGYRIEEAVIDEILRLSRGHPHFTQLICRELWNLGHTSKVISVKNLTHTLEAILETHAVFYTFLWRDLSLHQKNLLRAVASAGGKKIFSKDYLLQHNLGSFSTVQKSLGRLLAMQILEKSDDAYAIQDVFFQHWLNRRML